MRKAFLAMRHKTNEIHLSDLREVCTTRLNQIIKPYLADIPSVELKEAIEYSINSGGKRLRPLLVYATGSIFNASLENLDLPAAAIELIHTYSLVHDDMPCMDNADLRRGQPSCHKAYGEAMAMLVGDGLQTMAMQILTNHPATMKAERRLQMLNLLCNACGPNGMVAGQAMDLSLSNDRNISTDLLLEMYRCKTGALFSAAIEMGYLAAQDDDEMNLRALQEFAAYIGLAFQIQDDILDSESGSAVTGKPQHIDQINKKITYPILASTQVAKLKVEALYEKALTAINYLGNQAGLLRDLTAELLMRKT